MRDPRCLTDTNERAASVNGQTAPPQHPAERADMATIQAEEATQAEDPIQEEEAWRVVEEASTEDTDRRHRTGSEFSPIFSQMEFRDT